MENLKKELAEKIKGMGITKVRILGVMLEAKLDGSWTESDIDTIAELIGKEIEVCNDKG